MKKQTKTLPALIRTLKFFIDEGGGLPGEVQSCLDLIHSNQGNVGYCKRWLAGDAEQHAFYDYFVHQDLVGFRQWMHVSAKINASLFGWSHGWWYGMFWDHLMSNHPGLRDYVSHYPTRYPDAESEFSYWYANCYKVRHEFHTCYVFQQALRGEWQTVLHECEKALTNPPKSYHKARLHDYRFFQALARRDVPAMLESVNFLLSGRIRRSRNNAVIIDDHLSIDATLLCKLAWLHGIELDPQSDYVPRDWLVCDANPSYHDPYDFMRAIVLPDGNLT